MAQAVLTTKLNNIRVQVILVISASCGIPVALLPPAKGREMLRQARGTGNIGGAGANRYYCVSRRRQRSALIIRRSLQAITEAETMLDHALDEEVETTFIKVGRFTALWHG